LKGAEKAFFDLRTGGGCLNNHVYGCGVGRSDFLEGGGCGEGVDAISDQSASMRLQEQASQKQMLQDED